jgi:excisionase family DNA binding protein
MSQQEMVEETERWYSTQEAADYLGVTRWTVQRMTRRGELDSYSSPFDRRVHFYRGEDLDAIGMDRSGT